MFAGALSVDLPSLQCKAPKVAVIYGAVVFGFLVQGTTITRLIDRTQLRDEENSCRDEVIGPCR